VLQGDLQPMSKLQQLEVVNWQIRGEPVKQQGWTLGMLQEAQRWSHRVTQSVQQRLAPSWSSLKYLHLDIEMDRATLQAVANHCPQLQHLGCSTLAIKESQPQIQVPSLRRLSITFHMSPISWEPPCVSLRSAQGSVAGDDHQSPGWQGCSNRQCKPSADATHDTVPNQRSHCACCLAAFLLSLWETTEVFALASMLLHSICRC
jgi:hypothetical protein